MLGKGRSRLGSGTLGLSELLGHCMDEDVGVNMMKDISDFARGR